MPEDVDPKRIETLAAAARVPLDAGSPARIARAVTPTVARIVAGPLDMPFETEPSTFLFVQERDLDR